MGVAGTGALVFACVIAGGRVGSVGLLLEGDARATGALAGPFFGGTASSTGGGVEK